MTEQSGWASPQGDPPRDWAHPSPGAAAPPPPASPPPGAPAPASPPPGQPAGGPPPQPGPWGPVAGYPLVPPEVRPGIVPLRPLSLGEIYDGSFQAVRSNPAAMIGAAAVVVTVMTAIQLVMQVWMTGSLGSLLETMSTGDPEQAPDMDAVLNAVGTTSAGAAVTELVSTVALSVLSAIVIVVVGNAVLGRRTAGADLWARVRPRLLPLIGLTLLVGLITGAAVVVCLLPGVLAMFGSVVLGVLLLVVGVIAALCMYLWLDTRFALAGPALLLEEQKVIKSIGRAWRLTSRGFWRVLGIRLLTLVLVFVTTAIVSAPFQIVGMVVFGGDAADPFAALQPPLPALVLTGLGTAIAATIVYPFAAAVTALLYIDQRMRLEGLDVELARAAAEPA